MATKAKTRPATYSLNLPGDLREQLQAEAKRNDRSLAREMTRRLQESLKAQKRGAQQEAR